VKPLLPRLLLVVAVLACACSATPAPRALVMRDVTFPLRDLRFPSGLRVIIEEDHRAPTVAVLTLVGAGSTSDPPGKEGLAHYVEHLTFRSRPDGKASVWNLIERAGAGAWNATTGFDHTLYWTMGPKEALPALVTLDAVRMLAPVVQIAPDVAAVEREVVRNELRQRNETGFVGSIFADVQAAVFPSGHPYARPAIGTHDTISSFTIEDAQRFTREHYRPDNITMVVIGDVDMQTVARVVEESLPPELRAGAAHAASPRLAAVAPEPPAPPEATMVRRQAALATPELWMGWSLPRSVGAEGYLDRFVAAAAAGELPQAFWRDNDISSVHVDLVPGKEAALLLCRVALRDASDPERSAEHVMNRLVELWEWNPQRPQQGLSPGQLGKARVAVRSRSSEYLERELAFVTRQRSAVTAMLLGAESLVERGRERAELTHFSGDPTTYSRELRAVMSVDAGRVADFAYKYVTRERARSVLITPLPGSTPAPPNVGGADAVRLDDPPLPFDAQTIRAFIHPPGVSAYRRVVLENGLEVFIGRRAGLPVATVGLSLHGGAATASPPGADELARRLARPRVTSKARPSDFGGHLHDRYDRDDLSYVVEGSSGNVRNMLDLLADWVPSLEIREEMIPVFRRDLIPFLKKAETQPETQARRAFWSALFGPHPYGRTTSAADLEPLGKGDARGWVQRTAVPGNAVLAVVGEVDPNEVAGMVRDIFGRWSGGAPSQPPPPPPALPVARAERPAFVVAHRPGSTQGQIRFGCLLPPPAGESRARYEMDARILGAKLIAVLRYKLGASYGVSARVETLRGGAAHLDVTSDVDNAHLPRALEVLRRTMQDLEDGKATSHDVDTARWRVARSYAVRFGTNQSLVRAILGARNEEWDVRSIDTFPDALIAASAADMKGDFARCNTAPVLSIVGDEPTIRAALTQAWP
jgi:zinc protease